MTTPNPGIDVDSLPPTQYLILEVLAARHRIGEALWTFPARPAIVAAADRLGSLGLVGWKSGVVPKTIRVWLTDAGRAATLLDTYEPPKPRHAAAVLSWDWRQQPDLDRLARILRDMTGGDLHLRPIDPGSDEYAVVISTPPLDQDAANEAFERWSTVGGRLGDIFPVDPNAEQVAAILAGAEARRNPNPKPDDPDRLRALATRSVPDQPSGTR